MQKEREEKLEELLKDRLHQYVQGNKEAFVSEAKAVVSKLSKAGTYNSLHNIFHPNYISNILFDIFLYTSINCVLTKFYK